MHRSLTFSTLALVLLATIPVAGQEHENPRYDPASGDYFITIYNEELQAIEVRVVPANKVALTISPALKLPTTGDLAYEYTMHVPMSSPQALMSAELDCPRTGQYSGLRGTVRRNGDDRQLYTTIDVSRCYVMVGAAPLEPGGDTLVLSFETLLLPGIGEVRLTGAGSGLQLAGGWPTSDPIPQNDTARDFVWSVSGITGGWKVIKAVVPAREPSVFGDPTRAAALIHSDLERACGDLAWISNRRVCRSLQENLEEAARALERGNVESARGQIQGFLEELEARHGPEPAKHVNDNAYGLLRTNVAYLLGRL